MWTAIFLMKEIGKFPSSSEAFKAIYDAIHKEIKTRSLTVQALETTIWIIEEGAQKGPIYFNEARDMMYDMGYLFNGKWIENPP